MGTGRAASTAQQMSQAGKGSKTGPDPYQAQIREREETPRPHVDISLQLARMIIMA